MDILLFGATGMFAPKATWDIRDPKNFSHRE
jgi:hypothetical protein